VVYGHLAELRPVGYAVQTYRFRVLVSNH
jgi:hypothetical protein